MDLSAAIKLAAGYADPKGGTKGYHVAKLSPGRVEAVNATSGCRLACPDVTVEVAVSVASLKNMLGAMSAADMEVKRNVLRLSEGGRVFTLRGIPKSSAPTFPEPPSGDWIELTVEQVKAMAAICRLASSEDTPDHALSGIRLTGDWIATASHASMGVAWVAGLVEEAVTVPALLFKGAEGEVQFQVKDGIAWMVEKESGNVRWSRVLELEWPDSTVNATLATYRSQEGRASFGVHMAEIKAVADQARVVADSNASGHKLQVNEGQITLDGEGALGAYHGSCECGADDEVTALVGVSSLQLFKAVATVAEISEIEQQYMSLATATDAIMLWGGESPVVEVLLMPVVLS
tara:strand:+ start:3080 stop:4123 length:1044 start_codon:yes stop_codon:yes gene_type:complete